METDIVKTLRRWSTEAAIQGAGDAVEGLSGAAKEIERLRVETAAMLQQRDEARRWVCRLLANPTWATDLDKPGNGTAECFAKEQGWDCFKQGGGA